jgi:hypothetical protein
MGSFFGDPDGRTAECVLLKLMPGLCAHGFPSVACGGWAN